MASQLPGTAMSSVTAEDMGTRWADLRGLAVGRFVTIITVGQAISLRGMAMGMQAWLKVRSTTITISNLILRRGVVVAVNGTSECNV